jgi:hypothetical protein
MVQQASLEHLSAMNGNLQADAAVGLSIDMVTAAGSKQSPAASLDDPSKFATGH